MFAGLRRSVENATKSDKKIESSRTCSVSSLDSGISHCSSSASLRQPHLPGNHMTHAHHGNIHTTTGSTHISHVGHHTSTAHLSHTDNMHSQMSQLNGSSGYMSMVGVSRLGESHSSALRSGVKHTTTSSDKINCSSREFMLSRMLSESRPCVDHQLVELQQRLHFSADTKVPNAPIS